MRGYRLYFLDAAGHIARPPMIVECEDDGAAIESAKQFVNGKAIEVWDEGRMVVRLEAIHIGGKALYFLDAAGQRSPSRLPELSGCRPRFRLPS